jgi:hypothetical protein
MEIMEKNLKKKCKFNIHSFKEINENGGCKSWKKFATHLSIKKRGAKSIPVSSAHISHIIGTVFPYHRHGISISSARHSHIIGTVFPYHRHGISHMIGTAFPYHRHGISISSARYFHIIGT